MDEGEEFLFLKKIMRRITAPTTIITITRITTTRTIIRVVEEEGSFSVG